MIWHNGKLLNISEQPVSNTADMKMENVIFLLMW